jgi:prepilin-type N-terminal cleavage/methylation domain-containing protein
MRRAIRETAAGGQIARRSAFTLIELLVVIAIIALLVTILAPSLNRAKDVLNRIICASNMRQLGIAWTTYANNNQGLLVGSNTHSDPWDWVGAWGDYTGGTMWPYVQVGEVYKCTTPLNPAYPISYSIAGSLNGQASEQSPAFRSIWGTAWKKFTTVPRPSEALMIIEEDDWRGFNMGSWMLQNKNQWEDYVSGNHDDGDNLVFVDGHIEYWKWVETNTLAFPHQNVPFYKPDPGNSDLLKLWKVWACVD